MYSQDTLWYDDFMQMVKSNHPDAVNANLIQEQADLQLRAARGAFDPELVSKYKEKYFQDKFYYRVFDAQLVVPTLLGVDFVAGYGNNDGLFLNEQNYTPYGGTGYVGVKIPLGYGLFTDENRTQLNLAKQQKDQMNALAELTLNDLLLEASTSYWYWYETKNVANNQEEAINVAYDRFEMVRNFFYAGELAAIDTLKAYIQYQDRITDFLSAKQNEVNAHWNLMTYFWDTTLYLRDDLIPEPINDTISSELPSQANAGFWQTHPALVYYMTKYNSYDIERKLKAEKLKPKLNFEYTHLYNQVFTSFDGFGDNQVWGFSFSFPLFLREERNQLKISKLKMEQAKNEYLAKERELSTKLASYEDQFELIQSQIQNQLNVLENYTKLLDAETIKYRIGESTLFELNAWEQKQIKTQNKVYQLKSKLNVVSAKIAWVLVSWNPIP